GVAITSASQASSSAISASDAAKAGWPKSGGARIAALNAASTIAGGLAARSRSATIAAGCSRRKWVTTSSAMIRLTAPAPPGLHERYRIVFMAGPAVWRNAGRWAACRSENRTAAPAHCQAPCRAPGPAGLSPVLPPPPRRAAARPGRSAVHRAARRDRPHSRTGRGRAFRSCGIRQGLAARRCATPRAAGNRPPAVGSRGRRIPPPRTDADAIPASAGNRGRYPPLFPRGALSRSCRDRMLQGEAHAEAVPQVDHADQDGEIGSLLLGEMLGHLPPHPFGRALGRQPGEALGP